MIDIRTSDSVTGRLIPWLSYLGSGEDTVNGKHVTKSQRRLPISIGSSFFRKFECVEGCLVCCAVLGPSLDYIPTESAWEANPRKEKFQGRELVVNGNRFVILTNFEKNVVRPHPRRESPETDLTKYCQFLGPVRNGQPGCRLWSTGSPLACASAYNMRISEHPDRILITKIGMSRAWRYDPQPECTFHTVDIAEADLETSIHLFNRFFEWARYFDLRVTQDRLSVLLFQLEEIRRQGIVPPTITIL